MSVYAASPHTACNSAFESEDDDAAMSLDGLGSRSSPVMDFRSSLSCAGQYSPFSQARSSLAGYTNQLAVCVDEAFVNNYRRGRESSPGLLSPPTMPSAVSSSQAPVPLEAAPLADGVSPASPTASAPAPRNLHLPPGIKSAEDIAKEANSAEHAAKTPGGHSRDAPAAGIAANAPTMGEVGETGVEHGEREDGEMSLRVSTPTGDGSAADLSLWITTRRGTRRTKVMDAEILTPVSPSTVSHSPTPSMFAAGCVENSDLGSATSTSDPFGGRERWFGHSMEANYGETNLSLLMPESVKDRRPLLWDRQLRPMANSVQHPRYKSSSGEERPLLSSNLSNGNATTLEAGNLKIKSMECEVTSASGDGDGASLMLYEGIYDEQIGLVMGGKHQKGETENFVDMLQELARGICDVLKFCNPEPSSQDS